MKFGDFFNMDAKAISPMMSKKARNESHGYFEDMGKSGYDFGGGLEKYMRGVPDIGANFLDFIPKQSSSVKRSKGRSEDVGISGLAFHDVGEDYMGYIMKAANVKSGDYMSYLEGDTPRAFRTIGKEPKSITKRRFADKRMEVEYGAESLGFGIEGTERNIHRSARAASRRISETRADLKNTRNRFKVSKTGLTEETVGGRLIKKIKDYKERKESQKHLKGELEELVKSPDRQHVVQVEKDRYKREHTTVYSKNGNMINKRELESE